MRAEGVLRLILNVSLYAGMACLEDGKYVRTTVFENNERRFITFRVRRDFTPETHTDVNLDGGQTASNKTAMELSGAVIDAIPLETGASVEASRSPEPRALSDDAGGKSLSQQDGEEGQGDEGVERVADGDDEAV